MSPCLVFRKNVKSILPVEASSGDPAAVGPLQSPRDTEAAAGSCGRQGLILLKAWSRSAAGKLRWQEAGLEPFRGTVGAWGTEEDFAKSTHWQPLGVCLSGEIRARTAL